MKFLAVIQLDVLVVNLRQVVNSFAKSNALLSDHAIHSHHPRVVTLLDDINSFDSLHLLLESLVDDLPEVGQLLTVGDFE